MMDDYLTAFREAAREASAIYINPQDFVDLVVPGLGDEFTRADNVATIMCGCVGRYGSVRVYTDPKVNRGDIRRWVGF